MITCKLDGCDGLAKVKSLKLCGKHYERLRRHGTTAKMSTSAEPGEPKRFLDQAIQAETDHCIEWPFMTSQDGYARIKVNSRTRTVSHLVLEARVAERPTPTHQAAHKPIDCHNPTCINYRHLRWVTQKENSADMAIDGTVTRGERSGNAKLTEQQVREIRADERGDTEVAKEHPVSAGTIRDIRSFRRWAWLR